MKLYYYRHPEGNFGDELNRWLWPRLLPGLLDGVCAHEPALRAANDREPALFLGIGTILNDDVPPTPRKVVFGAGTGYGPPPRLDGRWHVYGVRGPLSARVLGLPSRLAIGDPAMLVPLAAPPPPAAPAGVAYLPHVSVADPWRDLCAEQGVHFLDPRAPVEEIIAGIRGCDLLLTEAMHGAIVADVLRVPWVALRSYRHINAFKWRDWCLSVGLAYRPQFLAPIWRAADPRPTRRIALSLRRAAAASALRRLTRHARPQLSDGLLLAEARDRLRQRLEDLRRDHREGLFEAWHSTSQN